MSRWISRALLALGVAGLAGCLVTASLRARDIANTRARDRAIFEQHQVEAGEMVAIPGTPDLPAFSIDKTEVTVAAYRRCVESGACMPPSTGEQCNWERASYDTHPINCVDHEQATAFCTWAGRRLPTAAEWERAGCREAEYPTGTDRPSPDQDCFSRHATWGNGAWQTIPQTPDLGTCPVDAHPKGASPFGALGMAGNVSEWTATEDSDGGLPSNRYVHKGASWIEWDSASYRFQFECKTSTSHAPHYRDSLLGFRCARSAERSLWAALVSR
jgi:formylglycine-generating enzyme required for sulfatase activity